MNGQTWLIGSSVILAACVFVGAQAVSQETQSSRQPAQTQPGADEQPDLQQMMEMWQKMATPGEPHEKLDYFVGEWKTTTKMWMAGPDAPPMTSNGSATTRWVLGGRFLMDEHEGTFMGMPLRGIGLTGYDNYKKKYVSMWCDSQNTSMHYQEGTIDQTGTVWTYFGTMDEWMTGEHDKTVKYIVRIEDADHYHFEIHDPAIVPGDTKVMQMDFERVE